MKRKKATLVSGNRDILSFLIFITRWKGGYYCFYFTDEETDSKQMEEVESRKGVQIPGGF